VPVGGMIVFTGTTSPNSNFIFPCGQAISRTTYATYFNLPGVGTTYGPGDGISTFNVPNLCGAMVAGLDGMGGGSKTNKLTVAGGNFDGSVLGNTGGAQNQTLAQANLGSSWSFPVSGITLNDPGHHHSPLSGSFIVSGAGSLLGSSTGTVSATTTTNTTGITIASQGSASSNGSGTPVPTVPWTISLPYLLRIF
jgi:microcystin-dependent protein